MKRRMAPARATRMTQSKNVHTEADVVTHSLSETASANGTDSADEGHEANQEAGKLQGQTQLLLQVSAACDVETIKS